MRPDSGLAVGGAGYNAEADPSAAGGMARSGPGPPRPFDAATTHASHEGDPTMSPHHPILHPSCSPSPRPASHPSHSTHPTLLGRPTIRPLRGTIAAALVVVLVLTVSACSISWSAGATHGAIIEPPAARASVGIWRAPTRALRAVLSAAGIGIVQQLLCDQGRFPPIRLSVGKLAVSADVLHGRWCGYVHGDDADLRGALVAAQDHRDDCLALTLISHGVYTTNWTWKSTGCKTGSL